MNLILARQLSRDKSLLQKPHDLSSIPRFHGESRGTIPKRCRLVLTHGGTTDVLYSQAHITHTHTHKQINTITMNATYF